MHASSDVVDLNGAVATPERERTAAAYLDIDAEADCACLRCRNYRRAWRRELMDADLLAACDALGIDPSKAHEVSGVCGFDAKTQLMASPV